MKIKMTIAKGHRKEIAKIVAEKLGTESEYLGVPSCAYKAGAFTFNKDCTVNIDEGVDMTPLTDILDEKGIGYETEDEATELNIEMPRDFYTDVALENLKKIVKSKENLIKKVVGREELPITISEDKVSFPWFTVRTPEESKAYEEFISNLSAMANEAKRVTAKGREVESEKYTFRCFLLRLGFKGKEYKETRRVLLRNLDGPVAFPNKAAADEFQRKQKEKKEMAS